MSERSADGRLCPLCKRPTAENFRPFCSKRCADLDLAHWLKGDYAIAKREEDDEEERADDIDKKDQV